MTRLSIRHNIIFPLFLFKCFEILFNTNLMHIVLKLILTRSYEYIYTYYVR